MYARLKSFLFAGDRQFVTLRGVSVLAALTFALIYSKQLGVERRGLLTFVMMTNLVFSILLISGISLHLRNITRVEVDREVLGTYISVIFLFSVTTPIINLIVLEIYQAIFNISIPSNLVYVCILYCFFSTLSYGMHDALLLIKSIKIASVMDIGVVLLQIASYLTLIYSGETSYFVSVLISISISYLVMVSATLLLLIYIYNPTISLSLNTLKGLLRVSSTPTLVNVVTQLLERVDKVFIGLQASSPELGRFSTAQSILGLSRFIPDAFAKLTIARNQNFLVWSKSTSVGLVTILCLGAIGAGIADRFMHFFLGPEWKLPLLMLFSIGVVEIFRGLHSLVVMNAVRANQYQKLKRVSVAQLLVGLILQPVGIFFFGLWASILCSLTILVIGIGVLKVYSYE
jgi:hypothetical protein